MSESWNAQLEHYLDGLLQGPELSAFEDLMRRDQRVREAVELQREIDASLRRRCAIPTAPAQINLQAVGQKSSASLNGTAKHHQNLKTLQKGDNASELQPPRQRLFIRRWALAAIILLAVCGAVATYYFATNPSGSQHASKFTFDNYYHRKVNGGYRPAWVCKDDQEFAQRFHDRFGQALAMDQLPQGMSCAGLDYATCISFDTVTVLLKDGETPIVVFIDRVAKDTGPKNTDRRLNVYRGEVGDLVLYELSPLDESHALRLFRVPADASSQNSK